MGKPREAAFEAYVALVSAVPTQLGIKLLNRCMPGCSLSDTRIGAGSVVTKDVEPYSVVGGVPAKLIRKRMHQGDKG